MCGMSGIIALNPKNICISQVKLLGILNRERGKDAFGIYYNKTLFKTFGYAAGPSSGDSLDAINHVVFPAATHPVVLMHSRAKTVGLNSRENTHPFRYEHDGKRFIFMKNGTIKNISELKTKYEINEEELAGGTDSEALGLILIKHGWSVLGEYTGGCAFVLYNETDNILYMWKGLSKHDSTLETEERPLNFYHNKKKNYIIFSSTFENLRTAENINVEKQQIQTPTSNTVVKLDCSTLEISVELVVDRSHIEFFHTYSTAGGGASGAAYSNANYFPGSTTPRGVNSASTAKTEQSNGQTGKKKGTATQDQEINPQNDMGNRVYYYKGLYWANGHLITGKYTILPGTGVVIKIEDKKTAAFALYKDLIDETDSNSVYIMYFVKGVWVKQEWYTHLLSIYANKNDILDFIYSEINKEFSQRKVHPEFLLYHKGNAEKLVIGDRDALMNTFPRFGRFIYYIENGRINSIKIKNHVAEEV